MANLEDKFTAIETVYRLGYALDQLNYHDLYAPFRPDKPFNFDIYAILKKPPQDMTPQEHFRLSCSSLGGFDSTQHIVTSPLATRNGDGTMHVKVMVNAIHVMAGESGLEMMTVGVTWDFDLEKEEGKWIITKWKIAGVLPMDRPGLMAKAHERSSGGKMRASIIGP